MAPFPSSDVLNIVRKGNIDFFIFLCIGIIRKTRTVMECLHRFCRECIDKSMRLGYVIKLSLLSIFDSLKPWDQISSVVLVWGDLTNLLKVLRYMLKYFSYSNW